MCPNVPSLSVNTEDGLETLYEVGQGGSVTFPEEVIILQELRQGSIADNFPVLELLPDVHGEQLGILGSVATRQPPRIQPARIKPRNIRPVKLLLLIIRLLLVPRLSIQHILASISLIITLPSSSFSLLSACGSMSSSRGVEGNRSFSTGVSPS